MPCNRVTASSAAPRLPKTDCSYHLIEKGGRRTSHRLVEMHRISMCYSGAILNAYLTPIQPTVKSFSSPSNILRYQFADGGCMGNNFLGLGADQTYGLPDS